MKTFKKFLLGFALLGSSFLFSYLYIEAWDNTMTDEEIVYYLEKYSTEEKLIKLAEKRNLIEKTE